MLSFAQAIVGYAVVKLVAYRRSGLNQFPGPTIAAITNLPYCYHLLVGDHPKWIASLHEKYASGPVVRPAPNEVSFTTTSSWRDIYCFRKNHGVFIKSPAYDAAAFTAQARSIVNERDPVEHAKMRKMLAPGFSDRAIRQQWPLINQTVDIFIGQLAHRAKEGKLVDLTLFFSLVSFDIATSLALGESFHSVEAGKMHPWAAFFKNGARAMGEAVAMMRFPWITKLVLAMKPPQLMAMIKELRMHEAVCIEMVKRREESPSGRPDIIGLVLDAEKEEGEKSSIEYKAAQLSDLVIAGTETTATVLSTANYFVMRDPAVLNKLRAEVRSRFKSIDDINPGTTVDLEYLNAVLNEAMRIMAPVPWPPGRLVPEGGDTVDGYFLPGGTWVSTSYFAAARSPINFQDPQEFRPERWIGKGTDKLDGSQPFGLGVRSCIGKAVGLCKLRLIMAKLHFKFDLEAADTELDWVAKTKFRLLWDKPALMVRLRERSEDV
ncbi:Averantin hydroxylase (Fragment) [Madurella fahalii]|uniref:Averantin hydroxylase n=1 Tax=Madurella fahalii TaxID=1157608 RepID=A0ABQ0G3T3_9PEZI